VIATIGIAGEGIVGVRVETVDAAETGPGPFLFLDSADGGRIEVSLDKHEALALIALLRVTWGFDAE
jgi:hypothetical protein